MPYRLQQASDVTGYLLYVLRILRRQNSIKHPRIESCVTWFKSTKFLETGSASVMRFLMTKMESVSGILLVLNQLTQLLAREDFVELLCTVYIFEAEKKRVCQTRNLVAECFSRASNIASSRLCCRFTPNLSKTEASLFGA
jgi:hypothetical protein